MEFFKPVTAEKEEHFVVKEVGAQLRGWQRCAHGMPCQSVTMVLIPRLCFPWAALGGTWFMSVALLYAAGQGLQAARYSQR